MYKRLTPCIFIERGKAVQWFDDRTVIADDVMELARHYNERGADELIISICQTQMKNMMRRSISSNRLIVRSAFRWLSEEIFAVQRM